MKILFYDAKKYDKESFDKVAVEYKNIEIEYTDSDISEALQNMQKGLKEFVHL